MSSEFIVFAGSAHPELAAEMAAELGTSLGECVIERFPDGETAVWLDESVRRREVFIVQPTSPPVNDHLVELLVIADACRRAAASRVTAIVPYFGYARSDKRHNRREPITASLVAQLMQAAGIDHLITVDLHAAQIEGFFHIPVDSLTAVPTLCQALIDRLPKNTVVVSPDSGRVKMASDYAQRLGLPVVVLHKQRSSGTETEVTRVVGDVRDRPCLIIDDMVATGGTITAGIESLLAAGARPEIIVAATHGLFLSEVEQRLSHDAIRTIITTDTVATSARDWPRLDVIPIAPLLAAAIFKVTSDGSLRDLY